MTQLPTPMSEVRPEESEKSEGKDGVPAPCKEEKPVNYLTFMMVVQRL